MTDILEYLRHLPASTAGNDKTIADRFHKELFRTLVSESKANEFGAVGADSTNFMSLDYNIPNTLTGDYQWYGSEIYPVLDSEDVLNGKRPTIAQQQYENFQKYINARNGANEDTGLAIMERINDIQNVNQFVTEYSDKLDKVTASAFRKRYNASALDADTLIREEHISSGIGGPGDELVTTTTEIGESSEPPKDEPKQPEPDLVTSEEVTGEDRGKIRRFVLYVEPRNVKEPYEVGDFLISNDKPKTISIVRSVESSSIPFLRSRQGDIEIQPGDSKETITLSAQDRTRYKYSKILNISERPGEKSTREKFEIFEPDLMEMIGKLRQPDINSFMKGYVEEVAGSGLTGGNIIDLVKGLMGGLPLRVKSFLKRYGNEEITTIRVFRKPIDSYVNTLLNVTTFGQFQSNARRLKYDNIFHVGLILEFGAGKNATLQKLERVEFSEKEAKELLRFRTSGLEFSPVDMRGKKITISEFINNTIRYMTLKKFVSYSVMNNCQVFALSLLDANGMLSGENQAFIRQDANQLFRKLGIFKIISDKLTGIASSAVTVARGGGDKLIT
jgi:hypothetical protein